MSDSGKAVFLSYTTDDKAVALAVCEALREGGVEVWMDQSELQGGDAWDAHIHQQLRDCALIIPIISARTQARREGYFRLEWRLADERMRLVAEGTPLIVPVVADDTQQKDALVPKSFLTVQWSRLPHGHVPPAFVTRVRRLLGLEPAGSVSPTQPPMAMAATASASLGMELLDPVESGSVQRLAREERAQAFSGRRLLPLGAVAFVAALVSGFAIWHLKPAPAVEPKPVNRFTFDIPSNLSFRRPGRQVMTFSPDGRYVVFNTLHGLYLRTLGELGVRLIPGTEDDLYGPVFSPDSQWIAFVTASGTVPIELRKISVKGGASVAIGPAGVPFGVSWEKDGTILYALADGIWRVPERGGTAQKIIPSEAGEQFSAPSLLPDGQSVLYTVGKGSQRDVVVQLISSGVRKVVLPGGSNARYLPETGHLLYVIDGNLYGIGFDAKQNATTTGGVPLVQGIRPASAVGPTDFAVSHSGTLAYLAAGPAFPRTMVWVDRQGKEEPIGIEPGQYSYPRISPDGTRIVLQDNVEANDLWVWDIAGKTRTRLTLGEQGGRDPLWSLDSTRVAYNSLDGRINWRLANNTRTPATIVDKIEVMGSGGQLIPGFFTPDGKSIVFQMGDIGSINLEEGAKPKWLLKELILEQNPELSPNGRWIAYQSGNETNGTYNSTETTGTEIYVRPFPNVDGDLVPVSTAGGIKPLWSPDGRELFYYGGTTTATRTLMSASVVTDSPTFSVVSRSQVLNRPLRDYNYYVGSLLRTYDVSADGKRFLMVKDVPGENATDVRNQILVVENWFEELKRLVPVGK